MKYLVVELKTTCDDVDGEWVTNPAECDRLFPCDTTQEVAKAVRLVEETDKRDGCCDRDWAVYEMVSGKFERRSIIMKLDGRFLYDVEVV